MGRGAWTLVLVAAMTPVWAAGRPSGWNESTHGRNAHPDYARVFAQDDVKRLDIDVSSADWTRLMADMTDMAGSFGAGGGNFGAGFANGNDDGGQIPVNPALVQACAGKVEGDTCQAGAIGGRCVQSPQSAALTCTPLGGGPGVQPPGNVGGGAAGGRGNDDVELLPRTPIYVPSTVTFDGAVFRFVGLRLKGNSSLVNSWRSGVDKLPLRLNFDALEAEHPEIRDQTFFGFPNVSLTNNSQDRSFLRAKVVGDLFREAGVPAARTAFVRVFLNRGAGSVYLGLYTIVEIPDRPLLETWFGSDDGNLYKPQGTCARWTCFDAGAFPKKSNEAAEDWTDIQLAVAALNAPRTDAAAWRAGLEATFNVSGFLRWLAANTVIGNTDTYGSFSPHNYYLYGSPRHRDRVFWMPWDHDLAMGSGPGGAGGGAAAGATTTLDIMHAQVASTWPVIRFLLDDPVYRAAYRRHVEDVLATVFEPAGLGARLRGEQARIARYVVGAEGEQPGRTFLTSTIQFDDALFGANGLLAYVQSRSDAARRALAGTR